MTDEGESHGQSPGRARSRMYAALAVGFCKPEAAPAGETSLVDDLRDAAGIIDGEVLVPLAEDVSRAVGGNAQDRLQSAVRRA